MDLIGIVRANTPGINQCCSPRGQALASRILEAKFCVLGLGLGLEGPGLGLEGPVLGLGLGLECPGLIGLGLGR